MTPPPATGATFKQHAARVFSRTLQSYRDAIASGDPVQIVAASVYVHAACRNRQDRAAVRRAFKEAATAPPTNPKKSLA